MSIIVDQLTTIENCKAMLGISTTDTTEDAAIGFAVQSVSELISKSCFRSGIWLASNASNPVTFYLSGAGDQWLFIREWPVQSITSIYEDDLGYFGSVSGSFGSQALLTQGVDYALVIDGYDQTSKSAMILRINDIWNSTFLRDSDMLASYQGNGYGNVKVTCTIGFTTLPTDLVYAATLAVSRMRQLGPYGRKITSESYEEYSVTLESNPSYLGILDTEVGDILANYRINQPLSVF